MSRPILVPDIEQ